LRNLAHDDASQAFDAILTSAATAAKTLPFLQQHLHAAVPANAEAMQRLIAELDSDQFARRRQASLKLEKVGQSAIPYLRKALEGDPSAQARKRVESLLNKVSLAAPRGEALRTLRANQNAQIRRHPHSPKAARMPRPGRPRCVWHASGLSGVGAAGRMTEEGKPCRVRSRVK
jgi:hypothetical protein